MSRTREGEEPQDRAKARALARLKRLAAVRVVTRPTSVHFRGRPQAGTR